MLFFAFFLFCFCFWLISSAFSDIVSHYRPALRSASDVSSFQWSSASLSVLEHKAVTVSIEVYPVSEVSSSSGLEMDGPEVLRSARDHRASSGNRGVGELEAAPLVYQGDLITVT